MNNKDYTKLYNILLKGINKFDPGDNLQLVNSVKQDGTFEPFINKYGEKRVGKEVTRILLNMKEDGLIRANAQPVQFSHYIINFNGLTTEEHNYLSVVLQPKAWRKIKSALQEEGFPLTPQSASRLMTKLIF